MNIPVIPIVSLPNLIKSHEILNIMRSPETLLGSCTPPPPLVDARAGLEAPGHMLSMLRQRASGLSILSKEV